MRLAALLIPLGLLAATPVFAGDEPARSEASIPFANHGGIDNWRAEDSRTIYFEDRHNQWYRAVLMAPAIDLPFVERIGIDAGPTGTLDRFGAVVVKGQRYVFASFERVEGPPSKASKAKRGIETAKPKTEE